LRSEIHNTNDFLEVVQWNLFNAGSIIINDNDTQLPQITEQDIEILEKSMDEMNKELPELKNFILPKGNKAVSIAHICRTIARKAEIQILECKNMFNFTRLNSLTIYLNRLSDFFFVYARYLGHKEDINETIWKN
jgi:cob(I)alamin adenosyltransferase